MIEHALNADNDIFILNGSFALVEDGEQVAQHVRTRLLFYLEEWFLDLRVGTAWFQEVFVKPFIVANTEAIIKERIANTPELNEITSFAMSADDPATRKLSVTFSAETTYGTIDNEKIYINS